MGEGFYEGAADLVWRNGMCKDALDGGHGGVGDTAMVYEGEVFEVGGDVEGEAVHGYPALHVDAYGGDLVLGDPDAGLTLSPGPSDAKVIQGAYQDFFQLPEVFAQVCAVSGEVHDGVADYLARTVVGYVSAAVGVEEPDATVGEFRLGDQHVIQDAGAAEGNDGGMFEEEEGIGDLAGDAAVPEVGLEVKGGLVVYEAEVVYLKQVCSSGGPFMFSKHIKKTLGRFSAAQNGYQFP